MNKQRIISLLEEASVCKDWKRANLIQIELDHAVHRGDVTSDYDCARSEGFRLVVGALFVETYEHKPWLLPSLAPVFILLCGDRDTHSVITSIWSDET